MVKKDEEAPDYYEGRDPDDIADEPIYLLNSNGKYLHRLDLGTFIAPKYALCDTCPFAPKNGGSCDEYMEDADCSIERTFFDVLIQSIAEHGIDDMDRLVIFPLAQQLFRLNRLYALEMEVNLKTLYDLDFESGKYQTMELYKELLKLISDNEKGYLQKLKELLATRKERAINQGRKGRQKSSDKRSLTDMFADDE